MLKPLDEAWPASPPPTPYCAAAVCTQVQAARVTLLKVCIAQADITQSPETGAAIVAAYWCAGGLRPRPRTVSLGRPGPPGGVGAASAAFRSMRSACRSG